MSSKFELFGAHLGERHAHQVALLSEKQAAQIDALQSKLAWWEARENELLKQLDLAHEV